MRSSHPRALDFFVRALFVSTVGVSACAQPQTSDVDDIARLAVLDVSAALQLVNSDTRCGFESQGVINAQELSSRPGTDGTVTRRVVNCEIDVSANPAAWPSFTCDKNAGTASGKIRFTGSRTIQGRLTSSASTPVIPSGVEPLVLNIERLEFDNFGVARLDNAGHLTLVDGAVSATSRIVLAVGKADGFCAEPTPNSLIEGLRFEQTTARFTNILRTRDYVINGSELEAVSGTVLGRENEFSGTLTLDGEAIEVPSRSEKVFDPAYSRQTFEANYACNESPFAIPVKTTCPDIDTTISHNTARLGGAALTTLVGQLAADKTCGFESPAVLAAGVTTGRPGEMGSITYRVTNCVLDYQKGESTPPDCNGTSQSVYGKATVSGTRTLKGKLTGDPANPIIPETDDSAEFVLESAKMEDFAMDIDDRRLEVASGTLSGKLTARLAKSTEYGICQVPTKIAYLSNINLQNARIHLGTRSGQIDAVVESSNLFAVNGAWKDRENDLWGTMVTADRELEIPAEDPVDFDTAYRRETFASSWQSCAKELAQPVSFSCGNDLPLPENVARLSIAALGALTNVLENDTQCGYANTTVRQTAIAAIASRLGEPETTATFNVANCTKSFPTLTQVARDCNGKVIRMQGNVTYRSEKTMFGWNTGSLSTPIVPMRRDAVRFSVTAELSNFTFQIENPDGSVTGMTIPAGTMQGTVEPRLALDKKTGVCSKSTPVSTFSNVSLRAPNPITLNLEGNRFTTTVANMNINAQNGSKDNDTNRIGGTLTVDGEANTFPIRGSDAFDPEYNQAVFDASYQQCDADLQVATSDEQCSFKEEVHRNAGRALVASVQAISNELTADADCGLNLSQAQRDPASRTNNSATWTAPPRGNGVCQYNLDANRPTRRQGQNPDCNGGQIEIGGTYPVRGQVTVRGNLRRAQDGTTYVNPTSHDGPHDFVLNVTNFQNLHVATIAPNGAKIVSMDSPSGTIQANYNPIMGATDDNDFTYLAPTPVIRMRNISFTSNAPVTIGVRDMTFKVTLSNVAVSAFSGTYNGSSNSLGGSLSINGEPARQLSGKLADDFDQRTFDASYACRPGLKGVVPRPE